MYGCTSSRIKSVEIVHLKCPGGSLAWEEENSSQQQMKRWHSSQKRKTADVKTCSNQDRFGQIVETDLVLLASDPHANGGSDNQGRLEHQATSYRG